MAKAIVKEMDNTEAQKIGDSSLLVDWAHLPELVYEYNLPYHKTRRFVLKLVRRGYAMTRAPLLKSSKKKPFDFVLTEVGKSKLKAELKEIKEEILSL